MHRVIRILVFAKDSESALDAAHKVVHEKLKTSIDGGPYDYYVDFTDNPRKDPFMIAEDAYVASLRTTLTNPDIKVEGGHGKDRWGPIPPVLQVSTARFPTDDPRGLEQVREAFLRIRAAFSKNMALIRYHVANYTDDELFGEIQGKGEVTVEGLKLLDDPRKFQYCCECVGIRIPEESYLFDFAGRCITRIGHLYAIITDSDEHPFFRGDVEGRDPKDGSPLWNQPLWIVPFDAHCGIDSVNNH